MKSWCIRVVAYSNHKLRNVELTRARELGSVFLVGVLVELPQWKALLREVWGSRGRPSCRKSLVGTSKNWRGRSSRAHHPAVFAVLWLLSVWRNGHGAKCPSRWSSRSVKRRLSTATHIRMSRSWRRHPQASIYRTRSLLILFLKRFRKPRCTCKFRGKELSIPGSTCYCRMSFSQRCTNTARIRSSAKCAEAPLTTSANSGIKWLTTRLTRSTPYICETTSRGGVCH